MASETLTSNANTEQSSGSFRVSGWSARADGGSLQAAVAGLGRGWAVTCYPQLGTCLVDSCASLSALHAALALRWPKVRVTPSAAGSRLKESSLESAQLTASISSSSIIDEAGICKYLKQFGNLRALTFSFSSTHQKWFCKASFYEKFSLDLLLRSNSVNLQIGNRSAIKIESLNKACMQDKNNRSGSNLNKVSLRVATETIFYTSNKKQQISSINSQVKDKNLGKAVPNICLSRGSKSCNRESEPILPSEGMFTNKSFFLQNVLRILKSRRNEINKTSVTIVRSNSVKSSSSFEERNFDFSSSLRKVRTQVKNHLVQEFKILENELLFLQIGQSKEIQHVNKTSVNEADCCKNLKSGNSYLSQSDLSDGHTAVERYTRSPVIKSTILTPKSPDSAKLSALIVLTKHSSDAEQSLPESTGRHTSCPSDSNFDTLFGSLGGQNNYFCVRSPIRGGHTASTEIKIDFFAFPSN